MPKKEINDNVIIEELEKIEKRFFSQKINNEKLVPIFEKKNVFRILDNLEKNFFTLLAEADSLEKKNSLQEEIFDIKIQKDKLISEIKSELVNEEQDIQIALIEIRPGTGGNEAGLWARDLFQMYSKFAETKK